MRPITKEWIDKAEGDWATARREMRARKDPNYDGVCFHAQQCAEKYLKARLQEANIAFSKTHDLIKLLKAVLAAEPSWNVLEGDLVPLTDFAVEYRTLESRLQEQKLRPPCRTAARSAAWFAEHLA